MNIRIFPPEDMIAGSVKLPLSKSFLNRLMIIDRIAGSPLPAGLEPEEEGTDIQTMRKALSSDPVGEIDVADAGTAMRFLTAYFAATPGADITLTGSERMLQRPVGPLVDALRRCGASVEYIGNEGFPPLRIKGQRLKAASTIEVDATVSSQFISALLMVAPTMEGGLTVDLEGPVKSRPYIALTLDMMKKRGTKVEIDATKITIGEGPYNSDELNPERDWSAVAFWAELVAISSGFIFMPGLDMESSQGDTRVISLFSELGVMVGEGFDDDDDEEDDGFPGFAPSGEGVQLCGSPDISPRLSYDFTECPDLAQAAAVTCCMIGVPFHFSGLETLSIKETDRVEALKEEMDRLGIRLTSSAPGTLDWEGTRRPVNELPVFDSHADHRMAMALAPVAFFVPGIVINGAECVSKSYPGFWQQLESLGFRIIDADIQDAPESDNNQD